MFNAIGNFFSTVFGFAGNMLWMALIAVFIQNTVFSRALGTSPLLYVIRKNRDTNRYSIWTFGLTLTLFSTIAALMAYFIYPIAKNKIHDIPLHVPFHSDIILTYQSFLPLIFILSIVLVYLLASLIIRIFLWDKRKIFFPIVHLAAFNSTVMGTMLLISIEGLLTSPAKSVGFGLGLGLGFIGACLLISASYDFLNSKHIPRAFRGFPITLLYIGILSLAFYGAIGGTELLHK